MSRLYSKYAVLIICFAVGLYTCTDGNCENEVIRFTDCRYGTISNGKILCEPVSTGVESHNYFEIAKELGVDTRNTDDSFVPFPPGSLSKYIKSKCGDTVIFICSGKKIISIIDQIGLLIGACDFGWKCLLKPIDSIDIYSFPSTSILVLPQGSNYTGPLVSYKTYEQIDISYNILIDSAKNELLQAWDIFCKKNNYNYPPIPPDKIHIEFYGVDSGFVPNSFYLKLSGYTGSSTSSWTALYKLSGNMDNGFQLKNIIKPSNLGYSLRFTSSFDLDGDGLLEYLTNDISQTVILESDPGGLKLVHQGGYRGC